MKLAIAKFDRALPTRIVTDHDGDLLAQSGDYRVVDAKFSHNDSTGGIHYVDVWGAPWRTTEASDVAECLVGNMEKWA